MVREWFFGGWGGGSGFFGGGAVGQARLLAFMSRLACVWLAPLPLPSPRV